MLSNSSRLDLLWIAEIQGFVPSETSVIKATYYTVSLHVLVVPGESSGLFTLGT